MKVDGESAYCQPMALVQKPDDMGALQPDEKLIKENQNGVSCGLKANERDVNCLSSQTNSDGLWNVSEFDCSTSDDSTNANENEVRDFEHYRRSSAQTGLYQKDVELYDAKSDMECELPELLVCYKESDDSVIKDICIDQGVTSLGKILFGNDVDKGKGLNNFLPREEDKNVGLVKGNEENTMSTPDDLKPSAETDCCKDSTNQFASMDPAQTDLSHKEVIEATKEKFVLGGMKPEDFQSELSGNHENGVNQQSVQISSEEAMSENKALVSSVEESNNGSNKSNVSPAPASAVEESNDNILANEIAYNSKVESGSITFNFNSSTPPVSNGKEERSSQNGDSDHLVTENTSKVEDGTARRSISNQGRYSPGESSFSVTGPLSGLITYSGPIAYSGSCSLRSDSSTTSTRSFAFPVLQAEWNSSPVRMRKAERRKHKGWREGLLCCRF